MSYDGQAEVVGSPRQNGKTTEYRDLVIRHHRKGREGNCPYCQEQWPCTVYRQVVT